MPKRARFLRRVHIGPQEKKLPAVLALLPLNHPAHRFIVVAAAGVFAAVGGDNKHGFVRHILPAGVFMDIADMANGPAHGVQQSRSAAG